MDIKENFMVAIHHPCFVCGRRREFFACRPCSDIGETSIIKFNLQNHVEVDETSEEKFHKGFISGATDERIKQLHSMVKEQEDILNCILSSESNFTTILNQLTETQRKVEETKSKKYLLSKFRQIQRESIEKMRIEKHDAESRLLACQKRIKRIKDKRSRIQSYIANRKSILEKTNTRINIVTNEIKQQRRKLVNELITDVFPISEITNYASSMSTSSLEDHPVSEEASAVEEELADATGLQFAHGRWFSDQSAGAEQARLTIVSSEAYLPGNGKYVACEEWLKSVRNQTFSSHTGSVMEPTSMSPKPDDHTTSNYMLNTTSGASIHAALCFVLQLMMMIRKLLDLHMPYKQHYKLLYDVNASEFKSTIKRLNYNVSSLCALCNVDLSAMNPIHTLRNINSAVDAIKAQTEEELQPLSYDLIDSIQRTLNDGSEPPSDNEDITFENSPDFDAIDWDKIRNEDITKEQDVSEIENPHSEPFQSVADETTQMPQGLVSSAVSWVTKGWGWGTKG